MASKQTVTVLPSGDVNIQHTTFENDCAAYFDMQSKGTLGMIMSGIESHSTIKETVTTVVDNGLTEVIVYKFDAVRYWEA